MWSGIEGISIMFSRQIFRKDGPFSRSAHPQDLCPLVFFPCGNVKIVARSSQLRSLDLVRLRITGAINVISETYLEIIHETPKQTYAVYKK